MSDNDSDEPIGRRTAAFRAKSRSSGSKKKNSLPAKNKPKRKIISSDEENMEETVVKKSEDYPPEILRAEPTMTMDIVESSKLTESSSLSPILGTSLEPPSFSPLLKGPPSPRHHNESLKWKHKVNLLGEKVVDPMIHICDKCHLPILIYARMIPCKHVFCLECGRAADKLCHKCNEKVSRVEQTTLGKVFMCTHQQSKTKEICKRTYLSQRDLQAHIAHRHVKCKEKEKMATAPMTRDPRSVHPLPATVPSAALQRVPSTPSVAAPLPAKNVAFNPPPPPAPPLPPIPALSGPVPPAGPPPPYLTPPPVYAPQMVPPPSAVYTGGQYPPVPSAVHAPAYVHGPHPQAYGQPPPPPTAYAQQPTAYDDFRGAPPPPPTHWQQRPPPPPRDYRAPPQSYYRQ